MATLANKLYCTEEDVISLIDKVEHAHFMLHQYETKPASDEAAKAIWSKKSMMAVDDVLKNAKDDGVDLRALNNPPTRTRIKLRGSPTRCTFRS